jgi:AcrR family transcriptional regulator
MRKDAEQNRRRLLDAAGDLLRTDPATVTVPRIAERAGLSPATAYRYFPSLDNLLDAYLENVIAALRDYSHDCPKRGTALFEDVVAEWARLITIYGPAMVQLRSRRGFLGRLQASDRVVVIVRDAWERPIRSVLRALGIPDEHFDRALFIYNILFDPREILGLQRHERSLEVSLAILTAAFYGALSSVSGGR